ncbi:hypothetical protein K505DRAFT_416488 [Melanomma pulvis-pyrius CBS 109.77]|uniref:Uncharacterized protein n=1 Tax=Melanomma pulvis-pyrius CBS 109.77 TaxID=1314802 RepID=A0A6A6XIB3_9PLEO|nr:hypothetical protein K505DRAFT_416488 [Melanomma pulvis-pyrius CBS 109.77]
MACTINPTNSNPTMPTSYQRSSTKSQDRRRSSTPSRHMSDVFSLLQGVENIADEELQRLLNGDFGGLPPVEHSQLLDSNIPFDDAAFQPLYGNTDLSNFGYDLMPTALAAVPAAGTQIQQDFVFDPHYTAGSNVPLYHDNHGFAPQNLYTDPETAYSQIRQPYFTSPYGAIPQQHVTTIGDVNQQLLDNSTQQEVYPEYQDATICAEPMNASSRRLQQRKRSRADSEDSEPPDKPYKKARIHSGDSATNSSRSRISLLSDFTDMSDVSDVSDVSERNQLKITRHTKNRTSAVTKYKYERPMARDDRPWVRTNNSTKGATTRTAKINNYVARYENRPHPLGDWKGSQFMFRYTEDGEFLQKKMSAAQINEFILEYPNNVRGAKLKLWIQRCPTDSALRYKSVTWSKCRFENCPAHIKQTGTILHGHYRVAFDEKWHRDRENADPFLTAGYVHLYCMERFLDFPEICRRADVEIDTRQLASEPKSRFAATLSNQPECGIANRFISAARHRNKLWKMPEFANYPAPDQKIIRGGKSLYHENTLTCHMHAIKEAGRPPAQRRQFEERGLSDSHVSMHLGDLEKLFTATPRGKKLNKQKKPAKKPKYDVDDEVKNEQRTRRSSSRSKKSKQCIAIESDAEDDVQDKLVDDDEPDDDFKPQMNSHISPQRSSTRIQNCQTRPYYGEDVPFFESKQQPQRHHQQLSQKCQIYPYYSEDVPYFEPKQQLQRQHQQLSRSKIMNMFEIPPRGRLPSHEQRLVEGLGQFVAKKDTTAHTTNEIPLDPALEIHPTTPHKSRQQSRNLSFGSFHDPEIEGLFDFDREFAGDGEDGLFRRRSRVSMSKSIMKRPSSSNSRRDFGDSERHVSIGKTTTREFYATQSPQAVASEGRRQSLRLQNKAADHVCDGRVSEG